MLGGGGRAQACAKGVGGVSVSHWHQCLSPGLRGPGRALSPDSAGAAAELAGFHPNCCASLISGGQGPRSASVLGTPCSYFLRACPGCWGLLFEVHTPGIGGSLAFHTLLRGVWAPHEPAQRGPGESKAVVASVGRGPVGRVSACHTSLSGPLLWFQGTGFHKRQPAGTS